MFARIKPSGPYRYLQIVANHREGQRTVQRVVATLGRLDRLAAAGAVDVLLRSLGRLATEVQVIENDRPGQLEAGVIRPLGLDLVFGRLWQTLGLQSAVVDLLQKRPVEFPTERAVYRTVLHRLSPAGSDRAAERWRRDAPSRGAEDVEIPDAYRVVQWLEENKGEVEKALFVSRGDLFTRSSPAFFNVTPLYFEGQAEARSRNHGDVTAGIMLTGDGHPLFCELWPGDRAVDRVRLRVVERLRDRFEIRQICWVADRHMIRAPMIRDLEQREGQYILGAPLRRQRDVPWEALERAGQGREPADDFWCKDVWVKGRRYVVCYDPEEAEAILRAPQDQPSQNDGMFVLLTNTTLPAAEVALQYQRLRLVEEFFRPTESGLDIGRIVHRRGATIAGHVFCSFVAFVLVDELSRNLAARGWHFEWADVRRDLEALAEVEVRDGDQWYCLRTAPRGVAGKTLRAIGLPIPPPVRRLADVAPSVEAIGNLPVIFHAQIFGAQDKGWLHELGVEHIQFRRFTTGTPILRAMATGQLDIAYVGVGPLLIAGHRGLPVKAVAATSRDTMAIVTTETFASIYTAHDPPSAAFAAFVQHTGRKLKIGTVPKGTTPDIFLRMWLTKLGADPESDIEIVRMGADQLVAAMTAGEVDGVVYGEPQITLIRHADPKFKVLLYGKDVVPGLPGGVLMVQQRLIDRYPALVGKLVEIHLRANKLFNSDKDFFARTVTSMLGEQVLPFDVASEAVRSPATHMVTDLRRLAPTLAVYDEFEVSEGLWSRPLTLEDMFECRFYDAVVQKHPELTDEVWR